MALSSRPSHNPPEDGGLNTIRPRGAPPHGRYALGAGPRHECLAANNAGVKARAGLQRIKGATTHQEDFILPYVTDLRNVVDMDAIRAAGLKLGVDPLGGASLRIGNRSIPFTN